MTISDLIKMGVNQKSYPQYLFKYRKADDANSKKIIIDNELWFCNPLEFNDPYDHNTPIDTSTSLDDIKNWLFSQGFSTDKIDYLANQLKINPNFMSDSAKKGISKTGVCCFSTIGDSILQWSHYSDYHKGICLKFDITLDPDFFLFPVIVSYRNFMQHYNHFLNADKIVDYIIRPKFYQWSYESEIRIVKMPEDIQSNENNRAFKFKNESLLEIIFGTSTPASVIDIYKKLCADNNKSHVKFFKMQLGSGIHYELIKIPT